MKTHNDTLLWIFPKLMKFKRIWETRKVLNYKISVRITGLALEIIWEGSSCTHQLDAQLRFQPSAKVTRVFFEGPFSSLQTQFFHILALYWKNKTELKITRSLNRSRNSKNFRALVDPRKSFGFLLSWKESKTVPKQKHCARSIGQFKDLAAQLDNKNTALAKSLIIMYFTDASTLWPWFVLFKYWITIL